MLKLFCGLALLAAAVPAVAGVPTTISEAHVFKAAPASRTVAIVRPETGSAQADTALAEGLKAAGLTVVAPGERPDLLVSYITEVTRVWGFFPNRNHAGSVIVPDSPVNDNYVRRTTVVAWDAAAPRPTQATVAWLTQLRSGGLSNEPSHFLPDMLRAGSAGYGRNIEPPRRPLRG